MLKVWCAYCGVREAMPGLVTAECRRCYDKAVDDDRRLRDVLVIVGCGLLAFVALAIGVMVLLSRG
ncbi:MAG: hypothetical protein ACRD1X_13510 [Vicinamibacteria bacterium]